MKTPDMVNVHVDKAYPQSGVGNITVRIEKTFRLEAKHVDMIKQITSHRLKKWIVDPYDESESADERWITLHELVDIGIIESDGMSWTTTYYLTTIGDNIASKL